MRERLQSMMDRTGQLSEETVGRERSELTEAERDAVDDLASQLADEREEAQDLMEELEQRASALERADPALSEGLRNASQRAREGRLEQNMGGGFRIQSQQPIAAVQRITTTGRRGTGSNARGDRGIAQGEN